MWILLIFGILLLVTNGKLVEYLKDEDALNWEYVSNKTAILIALITPWNHQPAFIREFHSAAQQYSSTDSPKDDKESIFFAYSDNYKVAAMLNADSFPSLRLLADNGTIFGLSRVYSAQQLFQCISHADFLITNKSLSNNNNNNSFIPTEVTSSEAEVSRDNNEYPVCLRYKEFWPYPKNIWEAVEKNPHWTTQILKWQLAIYFYFKQFILNVTRYDDELKFIIDYIWNNGFSIANEVDL